MSADGPLLDSTRQPVTRVQTAAQHEQVLMHLTAALKILGYEVFIGEERAVIHPQHEALIRRAQELVAEACKTTLANLLSSRRTGVLTRPRHLAMWLSVECTGASTMQIGRAFGRDHSTIIYAHKNFFRFTAVDIEFEALAKSLRSQLNKEFSSK